LYVITIIKLYLSTSPQQLAIMVSAQGKVKRQKGKAIRAESVTAVRDVTRCPSATGVLKMMESE